MNRSVVIGFVIYKPESCILNRIRLSVDLGFDIYIFDNSPELEVVRLFCLTLQRVHYFTCGKNHGLGLGVSAICSQAYYENNSALVFFDQDSIFDETTLNFIDKFYVDHPALNATHSAVVFNARMDYKDEIFFHDVQLAINSGSLFYLNNLRILNWHNEAYFVDGVDYEFCLRSRLKGFKIGEYSCTPGFDHSAEQPDRKYLILGKAISMRNYAYSRIVDVSISNLKLIVSSIVFGEINLSFKFLRLWITYLAFQALVRVIDFMDVFKIKK